MGYLEGTIICMADSTSLLAGCLPVSAICRRPMNLPDWLMLEISVQYPIQIVCTLCSLQTLLTVSPCSECFIGLVTLTLGTVLRCTVATCC